MKLHENPSFTNIVDTRFTKTRPVGAELFHVEGRTHGRTDRQQT